MILRQSVTVACILVLVMTLLPLTTSAQIKTIVPCDGTSLNGGKECKVCDIAVLAQNVMNGGIYVAIFLSAILFAWAGWKYLTNAANPGEVSNAKKIFASVLGGLVLILASWLIIDTLMKTLVGQGGQFGPWNKICELFLQSTGLA